jgi:hypothetical protein
LGVAGPLGDALKPGDDLLTQSGRLHDGVDTQRPQRGAYPLALPDLTEIDLSAPAKNAARTSYARRARILRALWWFFWIPGNPEVPTSRDLRARGLDREMAECDLDVTWHETTTPDWIEAFAATPAPAA